MGVTGDAGPAGPKGDAGPPGPPSFLMLGNFPDSNGGFIPPNGDRIVQNEANTQVLVPGGVVRRLRMRLRRVAAGAGHAVATVRRNGKDTTLVCRVDFPAEECDELTSVSFADGDLLSISYGESNAPDTRVQVLLEFVAHSTP